MSEPTIEPRDYPLSAPALPMLCEYHVWRQWREAVSAWHREIAERVAPEYRAGLLRAYYQDRSGIVTSVPMFNHRVGRSGLGVTLSPAARSAADEIEVAERAMRASAIGRVQSGAFGLIATPRGSLREDWVIVRPDRLAPGRHGARPELSIAFGLLQNFKRESFTYKMRDETGMPMDQARLVYGEADTVTEIEALEAWGAPDALGPDRFFGVRRQADIDKAATVPDLYRTRIAELQESLIGRLAAGALVAIDQGMIVPPDVWRDPSKPEHQAIAARVLIRSPLRGDVTEASEPVEVEKKRLKPGVKKIEGDEALIDEAEDRIGKGEQRQAVYLDIADRAGPETTSHASRVTRLKTKSQKRRRNQMAGNGRQ